ncbi:hypothetical protein FHG87_023063 [Trinorchestia longiramus]|nr:hypothetical protein FHG87_023063 [Trinorchestia longiramus]
MGQSFPELGQSFPELGQSFPELGQSFPELGQSFPELVLHSNSSKDSTTTTRRNCNCSGNHTQNYKGCSKMEQTKEVEKICQL